MEITNTVIDESLKILYNYEENGIHLEKLITIMFPNNDEAQKIWKPLADKLYIELRIADYNLSTGIIKITERGKRIYYDYGSYTEYEKSEKGKQDNLKLQKDSIKASVSLSYASKILGILTIICLVAQVFVSILQYAIYKQQLELQKMEYRHTLQLEENSKKP